MSNTTDHPSSAIKTVIGPVHPGLKEPIQFVFELEGEKIKDVDFKPGHAHRGIEWMGTRRNVIQIVHTAERICGICGVSHTLSFCRAVEQAAGIEVPVRADYLRTIYGELERMHSHLLWAGVAAMELGFDTLFFKAWEVRENVMDLLEYLSGNRVNYGTVQVGGMRRDITPEQYPRIHESMAYYAGIFESLAEMFLDDTVLKMRCRGTGVLSADDALKLCTVGPTIRASGIPADVRQDHPYCAYGDLEVRAITPQQVTGEVRGDVYDRIIVRLHEVKQSAEIIEQCLARIPEGPINAFSNLVVLLNHVKKAEGEGIGRHEAPRGEVFHYVRLAAGEESPSAWKVKASTYSNLMSWLKMLKGEQVADIPIIVASIDPCISCTDRVALVGGGAVTELTRFQLRALSAEKTRRLKGAVRT
jgi:membrane-bound hydrogenase subunit alpha